MSADSGWSGMSGQGLRKSGSRGSSASSQLSIIELFPSNIEVTSNAAKLTSKQMNCSISKHYVGLQEQGIRSRRQHVAPTAFV